MGHNRAGRILWFTNLDTTKRHEKLNLYKKYTPEEYPKYDNYDAINVNKYTDIPYDYTGYIGVPITFIDKYNPEQFKIVRFRKGNDDKDLSINGKYTYFRIIIKNKKVMPRTALRYAIELMPKELKAEAMKKD